MFFESWVEIFRIVITTLLIYPMLIMATHLMGKRSLAKLNNFDWLVTVAIGSILGSAILLKDVVIVEVIVAVGSLLTLQYILTFLSSRYSSVDEVIKTSPVVLFYRGNFIETALKKERVSRNELKAEIRKAGFSDLDSVSAVIFESDGLFSVIAANESEGNLVKKVFDTPAWRYTD